MAKVKTFKLLPLMMLFSGNLMAETTDVATTNATESSAAPVQQSVQQATQQSTDIAPQTVQAPVVEATPVSNATPATQDGVLTQLSFEAQQARAAELAKQADYALEQEQIRQEEARKLAEAETKIAQTIGNNGLLLGKAVTKVYLDRNFQPLWNEPQAEKQFLKEYALFAVSGASAKSAIALQQILNQPAGFARDILLTDAFLDYLYYNKNVYKNAENWLYRLGTYNPKAPDEALISQWVKAVDANSATKFVANLEPRNHIYQQTAQKLLSMAPGATVSNGNSSKKAKKGAAQAGAATTANASFYKLALNLQRLRIIPSFDNGIFVNIPSYQLNFYRDGHLTLHSKVIVGRDDRRTPVMYSKLSNVVVNPPWNVPPTILSKDIVPKLARDPSYADRASLEIFDGSGNKINPRSVNWSKYVNSKSIPYRIRQKAGDDSALGRFKFNMPSSNAIYLHDTPNRGLFGKNDRALSSGCVRVERSDELASILLKEAGWTMDKKQNVLDSKKTTSANVHSDNPVYLYYVTAWVENGKLQTLPDIYNYDTNIPKTSVNWAKIKNSL